MDKTRIGGLKIKKEIELWARNLMKSVERWEVKELYY